MEQFLKNYLTISSKQRHSFSRCLVRRNSIKSVLSIIENQNGFDKKIKKQRAKSLFLIKPEKKIRSLSVPKKESNRKSSLNFEYVKQKKDDFKKTIEFLLSKNNTILSEPDDLIFEETMDRKISFYENYSRMCKTDFNF